MRHLLKSATTDNIISHAFYRKVRHLKSQIHFRIMGLFAKSQPKSQPRPDLPTQHYHGHGATAVAHTPEKQQYQGPPNGFANENPQIPGQRPRLQVQLDPNFRAAGKNSAMFGAFVKAHDKMSQGQV
ncbi:hypothetical protein SLS62_009675 [Diatrype stigma]|uniref:Uncharacterized protein n=1 Tax=Diatrype stigma TaxID=117547 RepID=A0AAN9UK49_9PEZI